MEDLVDPEFSEFTKLKYILLCSSNTCIQFMLRITFLKLILFLKSFLRMNYYQLSQIGLPHNKYDGLTLRSSLWSITWVGYIT